MNFVDVGQGDGTHIQTPNDAALIVDAGVEDNLYRFLRWRFGKFKKPFQFESAVISHSDKDHYFGFTYLFDHPNVQFGAVYHNCIVEHVAAGKNSLGKIEKPAGAKRRYITGLVLDREDLKKITNSAAKRGRKVYPKMLRVAEISGRVGDIKGLLASSDLNKPKYYPGYSPADNKGMTIKLLGPFPTFLSNGKAGLPTFGGAGKTKKWSFGGHAN